MTTEQFEEKVKELTSDSVEWLQKECVRLFKSGAVDTDGAEDNCRLPKNILVVALENLSRQYLPFHNNYTRIPPQDEKTIRNLRKF